MSEGQVSIIFVFRIMLLIWVFQVLVKVFCEDKKLKKYF